MPPLNPDPQNTEKEHPGAIVEHETVALKERIPGVPHTRLVVIGSGPAGHTAAIYAARALLRPIMFEGEIDITTGITPGGQLTSTTEVENFPGFPKGVTGPELCNLFREQSSHHGTDIRDKTVTKVDLSSRPFKIWTADDPSTAKPDVTTDSLIIATGATAKRLFIKGEDTLWQAGISACAVCDGAAPIFRNKELAVVGGGDTAVEESLFLTKYASKVHVLVRRDVLRASKVMASRLQRHPKVQIHWNTAVTTARSVESKFNLLTHIDIVDTQTNQPKGELPVAGLFYAIGHQPNTKFLDGQIKTDSDGYILTRPGTATTDVKGVYAAGDVQDKRYRQAITAAGSGCQAALEAAAYLEELEEEENSHDKK